MLFRSARKCWKCEIIACALIHDDNLENKINKAIELSRTYEIRKKFIRCSIFKQLHYTRRRVIPANMRVNHKIPSSWNDQSARDSLFSLLIRKTHKSHHKTQNIINKSFIRVARGARDTIKCCKILYNPAMFELQFDPLAFPEIFTWSISISGMHNSKHNKPGETQRAKHGLSPRARTDCRNTAEKN